MADQFRQLLLAQPVPRARNMRLSRKTRSRLAATNNGCNLEIIARLAETIRND